MNSQDRFSPRVGGTHGEGTTGNEPLRERPREMRVVPGKREPIGECSTCKKMIFDTDEIIMHDPFILHGQCFDMKREKYTSKTGKLSLGISDMNEMLSPPPKIKIKQQMMLF